VMYRKIDTTPLLATFATAQGWAGMAAGFAPGRPGTVVGSDRAREESLLIPSRMTHRPLFPPAGGPSERMKP